MLIVVLVFGTCLLGLVLWLWPWPADGPRCQCGRLPAYMLSDGSWECDDCREARIGARAPKGG